MAGGMSGSWLSSIRLYEVGRSLRREGGNRIDSRIVDYMKFFIEASDTAFLHHCIVGAIHFASLKN